MEGLVARDWLGTWTTILVPWTREGLIEVSIAFTLSGITWTWTAGSGTFGLSLFRGLLDQPDTTSSRPSNHYQSHYQPTRLHHNRKKRGHVSAGHGRIGKHRKHPGGRGLVGFNSNLNYRSASNQSLLPRYIGWWPAPPPHQHGQVPPGLFRKGRHAVLSQDKQQVFQQVRQLGQAAHLVGGRSNGGRRKGAHYRYRWKGVYLRRAKRDERGRLGGWLR